MMMRHPYEMRYKDLLNYVYNDHPFVISYIVRLIPNTFDNKNKVTSRIFVTDSRKLLHVVENIISNEGEGIVLRRPTSLYHHGRSLDILKIKVHSTIYSPTKF